MYASSTRFLENRLQLIHAPRYEVISKCGKPNDIQVSLIEKKISNQYFFNQANGNIIDKGYAPMDTSYETGTSLKTTIQIEKFVYDFGINRLIHVLTFEDGILTQIETGDYGIK